MKLFNYITIYLLLTISVAVNASSDVGTFVQCKHCQFDRDFETIAVNTFHANGKNLDYIIVANLRESNYKRFRILAFKPPGEPVDLNIRKLSITNEQLLALDELSANYKHALVQTQKIIDIPADVVDDVYDLVGQPYVQNTLINYASQNVGFVNSLFINIWQFHTLLGAPFGSLPFVLDLELADGSKLQLKLSSMINGQMVPELVNIIDSDNNTVFLTNPQFNDAVGESSVGFRFTSQASAESFGAAMGRLLPGMSGSVPSGSGGFTLSCTITVWSNKTVTLSCKKT